VNEIQRKVKRFVKLHKLECKPEFRFLDLVSELGEFAKEIINATDYGRKKFRFREKIKAELGDVLFSLLALANQLNIDVEKALEFALKKYEKRIKERGKPSSS